MFPTYTYPTFPQLKILVGGDCFRVKRFPQSYAELEDIARKEYETKLPDNFCFKYEDCDKDSINMESQSDFEAFIEFCLQEQLRSIKIRIDSKSFKQYYTSTPAAVLASASSHLPQHQSIHTANTVLGAVVNPYLTSYQNIHQHSSLSTRAAITSMGTVPLTNSNASNNYNNNNNNINSNNITNANQLMMMLFNQQGASQIRQQFMQTQQQHHSNYQSNANNMNSHNHQVFNPNNHSNSNITPVNNSVSSVGQMPALSKHASEVVTAVDITNTITTSNKRTRTPSTATEAIAATSAPSNQLLSLEQKHSEILLPYPRVPTMLNQMSENPSWDLSFAQGKQSSSQSKTTEDLLHHQSLLLGMNKSLSRKQSHPSPSILESAIEVIEPHSPQAIQTKQSNFNNSLLKNQQQQQQKQQQQQQVAQEQQQQQQQQIPNGTISEPDFFQINLKQMNELQPTQSISETAQSRVTQDTSTLHGTTDLTSAFHIQPKIWRNPAIGFNLPLEIDDSSSGLIQSNRLAISSNSIANLVSNRPSQGPSPSSSQMIAPKSIPCEHCTAITLNEGEVNIVTSQPSEKDCECCHGNGFIQQKEQESVMGMITSVLKSKLKESELVLKSCSNRQSKIGKIIPQEAMDSLINRLSSTTTIATSTTTTTTTATQLSPSVDPSLWVCTQCKTSTQSIYVCVDCQHCASTDTTPSIHSAQDQFKQFTFPESIAKQQTTTTTTTTTASTNSIYVALCQYCEEGHNPMHRLVQVQQTDIMLLQEKNLTQAVVQQPQQQLYQPIPQRNSVGIRPTMSFPGSQSYLSQPKQIANSAGNKANNNSIIDDNDENSNNQPSHSYFGGMNHTQSHNFLQVMNSSGTQNESDLLDVSPQQQQQQQIRRRSKHDIRSATTVISNNNKNTNNNNSNNNSSPFGVWNDDPTSQMKTSDLFGIPSIPRLAATPNVNQADNEAIGRISSNRNVFRQQTRETPSNAIPSTSTLVMTNQVSSMTAQFPTDEEPPTFSESRLFENKAFFNPHAANALGVISNFSYALDANHLDATDAMTIQTPVGFGERNSFLKQYDTEAFARRPSQGVMGLVRETSQEAIDGDIDIAAQLIGGGSIQLIKERSVIIGGDEPTKQGLLPRGDLPKQPQKLSISQAAQIAMEFEKDRSSTITERPRMLSLDNLESASTQSVCVKSMYVQLASTNMKSLASSHTFATSSNNSGQPGGNRTSLTSSLLVGQSSMYKAKVMHSYCSNEVLRDNSVIVFQEIINNGTESWPEKVYLRCISGVTDQSQFSVVQANKGEYIVVAFPIKIGDMYVPANETFKTAWRLYYYQHDNDERKFFGPKITIEFTNKRKPPVSTEGETVQEVIEIIIGMLKNMFPKDEVEWINEFVKANTESIEEYLALNKNKSKISQVVIRFVETYVPQRSVSSVN